MGSIELVNVCKAFGGVKVINSVDFAITDGSFTVFVGPSGCGKSTLLRMIAGLEDVTSGQVLIDGLDMTNIGPAKRGLAMVFQSYALYPHMSVRGNIAFALKMARQPANVIEQKVKKAAGILNLTEYLDRKPRELSGGQRQRVAIGRAIVREPKAFLFDEPLSNLDAALRVQMRVEIDELHQKLKTTMVYVTHDQVEAMTMADRIVVLDKGAVAQIGSPLELYNKPNGLFVASFIGSPTMNLVMGPSAAKRGATTLGVRPEHVELSTTAGEWPAQVLHAEHLGSETFIYARAEGIGPLTIRLSGEATHHAGDRIFVTPREAHVHRFDKDGKRIG